MADKVLAAELDIAIDNYLRKMKKAEGAAKSFDTSLKGLSAEARKASSALNGLKDVNVNIEADTSSLSRAEGVISGLDGSRASVEVQADTSQLDRAESQVQSLNGARADVQVTADVSQIDRVESDVRSRFKNIQLTFDVGQIPNIIGNIPQAISNAPLVSTLADTEGAMRVIETRTGLVRSEIDGVGTDIQNLWVQGFGDTQTAIAEVTATALQAGLDVEQAGIATRNAFVLSQATGEDVNTLLRAQISLVRNNLVPGYGEAGDLLATGFRDGLNNAQDLLDTTIEYSADIAGLNLTGQQFFSLLNAGLADGAYNTDKLADGLREVKIRIDTALSAGEGAEFEGLQALGLVDEAEAFRAGEMTAQEFLTGAAQAIRETGNLDAAVTGLFGSPIEDLGMEPFLAALERLDFGFFMEGMGGAIEETATTATDTLSGQLTSAARTFETELAEAVRIGGAGLSELMDSATDKLRVFVAEVQGGAGIPEALSIALEAPELAGQLRDLQATIGGFILDFQLMLAGVADIFGQGEAAAGLRAGVAEGAAAQLEFDLIFSEGDVNEVITAYNNAIRRGVDTADVSEAFNNATITLAEDFGLEAARAFDDAVSTLGNIAGDQPGANAAEFGASTALEFFETTGFQQAVSGLVEPALSGAWSEAVQNVLNAPVGEVQQAAVTELTNMFNDMLSQVDPTVQPVTFAELVGIADTMAIQTQFDGVLGTQAVFLDDVVEGYRTAQGDIEGTLVGVANTATTEALRTADALDPILVKIGEVNQAVFDTAMSLNNLYLAAGVQPPNYTPNIPIDGRATGGPVSGGTPYLVGERGMELFIPSTSGTIIPHSQTMAAMGGSTTVNNTVVYNVNQNLNAGNMAQASAAGGRFANQLRGYN